jgi:hypothetical protein
VPHTLGAPRPRIGTCAAWRLVPAPLVAALAAFVALACSAGDRPPSAQGRAGVASQAASPRAGTGRAPAGPVTPGSSAGGGAPTAGAPTVTPPSSETLRDETLRELSDFRLTQERVDRWGAAQRKLNELTRQNPEIINNMVRSAPPKTLDEMVARFDGQPGVHKAIAGVGFSPREYVLTMLSLQRALQGYFGKRAGQLKTTPPGVAGENIAFVQQHMAEIQQLMGELRRMKERPQTSDVKRQ